MELGRHGGVCGSQNVVRVAELTSISESDKTAKRALINKQKRDRKKRRHESMYADGETPHPQRQKILKISGNAVTSWPGTVTQTHWY